MNSSDKRCANLNVTLPRPDAPEERGRAGRGRVLKLMKETLTVRTGMSDALRRGDEVLRQYQTLLEVGTDYDVAVHEVFKHVAFVVDEVRHRVRFWGVREPSRHEMMMNAERLLKAGEIKPWGACNA